MDLSDYESLRPGRQALLPLSWGRALPGEVAQLLLGLGQAANEAGLALQDAQALWARISDVQDRREWLNSSERQAVGSVAEDLFDTTMHYIEELTGIYAVAVARYAACAVETAGRAINQQPILIPTPLAVVPSDILQLAQIHVPLIQIPIEMMPARWQHRAQVENGGLSTGHRLLQAAMQAVRNPPRPFDGPGQLHRANQQVLETEFPSALHAYAADCAISGALVAWATTDQQGS